MSDAQTSAGVTVTSGMDRKVSFSVSNTVIDPAHRPTSGPSHTSAHGRVHTATKSEQHRDSDAPVGHNRHDGGKKDAVDSSQATLDADTKAVMAGLMSRPDDSVRRQSRLRLSLCFVCVCVCDVVR